MFFSAFSVGADAMLTIYIFHMWRYYFHATENIPAIPSIPTYSTGIQTFFHSTSFQ